ncbi:hypothetical protein JOB18_034116 [Solea senegalensis]|uniref:Uncharacterized protein n=1 Tax=Solea senegalensis TaxID=28829 RepID=A0AAV6PSB4_SOLSE|nr:hypothetical protein JOB18_034116 [Solea senegalensis]
MVTRRNEGKQEQEPVLHTEVTHERRNKGQTHFSLFTVVFFCENVCSDCEYMTKKKLHRWKMILKAEDLEELQLISRMNPSPCYISC